MRTIFASAAAVFTNRHGLSLVLICAACILLAACARQPSHLEAGGPLYAFIIGLIHGALAIVDLIVGFFDPSVRIYAYPNPGWFYDLGFICGSAVTWAGGTTVVYRR